MTNTNFPTIAQTIGSNLFEFINMRDILEILYMDIYIYIY